jgi:hypothetical protein
MSLEVGLTICREIFLGLISSEALKILVIGGGFDIETDEEFNFVGEIPDFEVLWFSG